MWLLCVQDRQLHCGRQLEPCSRPLSRIKLKLFGSSGIGKTALIEALKCGYLGGLLRSTFRTSPSPTASSETPNSAVRSTYAGIAYTGIIGVALHFSFGFSFSGVIFRHNSGLGQFSNCSSRTRWAIIVSKLPGSTFLKVPREILEKFLILGKKANSENILGKI